ncbi:uncharacterized protein LOC109798052 [Cajanus cajan]|uniref:uncharacterized protein LOC109798052 n=1 Tax=Cajanus cajan TaxID=3821 RepID=UPI00098DC482|nr:uncharacterized protein LOC109798052 [Cajanus cajan]
MSTLLYKYLVEAVATMFPPLYLLLYGAKSGSVHNLPENMSFMAVKESNTSQKNHQQQEACDPCKSFGQKCSHLVKKQRAKFYILRRCIAMLLCWHERAET